MKRTTSFRIQVFFTILSAVLFLTVPYLINNVGSQSQPAPSSGAGNITNGEAQLSDLAPAGVIYNFNELTDNTYYGNLSYPYARFYCYNSGLYVTSWTGQDVYPKFIGCSNPIYFGTVGAYFNQPVHNVTFRVVGGDGGTFKVDLYQNRQYIRTLTFSTTCYPYVACLIDLRQFTNVSGIDMHSVNDIQGIGYDDFSFDLGANPTPTPTPTPNPNSTPIGFIDIISSGTPAPPCPNAEEGTVCGWSLDTDNQDVNNRVDFYVDGLACTGTGCGTFAGNTFANLPRPDVNSGTGYRGNHGYEFLIPNHLRDGRQHTIYAYGIDTNGTNHRVLTGSPKTFTLNPPVSTVDFESVVNETIGGELVNSQVETLTSGTTSGEQRIFPDAKDSSDSINHKKVRVKATLLYPVQNIQVFFRNFDVDDPSSNAEIDDNGMLGDDNHEGRVSNSDSYSTTARGTFSGTGCTVVTNGIKCPTNTNGVAVAYFTVTKQPGDNFVVAASTNESYINGVNVNGTGLKDSANAPLPTAKAKRTKLLTVWRKLYMEVDTMGQISDNFITGYVKNNIDFKGTYVNSQPKWITVYHSKNIPPIQSRYKATYAPDGTTLLSYGGRMVVGGGAELQILDSRYDINENFGFQLKVQSSNSPVYLYPNAPFKLYDDDDFVKLPYLSHFRLQFLG